MRLKTKVRNTGLSIHPLIMSMAISYLFWCILPYLQSFFIGSLSLHHGNIVDIKVLNVGEELERETLPLKMGKRIYHVAGLKESAWYEIKISYPASIPASFSIQLKRDAPELGLNKNRRLLNTEKVIFKFDSHNMKSVHGEIYVLVTVEAAGFVAKPGVHERKLAMFNIVCDELSLGIPHNAWWVGTAGIFCLLLASVLPYFFPSQLFLLDQSSQSGNLAVMKAS